MYGVYGLAGGIRVTIVGENEQPPHGIYASDGSYRVTQDVGQGLYAPNGSYRVGYEESRGTYTSSGALNGDLDTVNSIFYPNTLGTGDVIYDTTVIRDTRVIRTTTKVIDRRS